MADYEIRDNVLDYDNISEMVPALVGHRRLVNFLLRMLTFNKVNWLHSRNCHKPGAGVPNGMLADLNVKLDIDGLDVLDNLPKGPFITVSNHPFGGFDGIMLTSIIGSRRPDYKVMVNMTLNLITGMRQFFIAVDALDSKDPAKKAVSVRGIKEAIQQVRDGHVLGFFPAGAVSKINKHLRIEDREWQPNVARIIRQCNVPVIPIYFHGHNSTWFNILGLISWKLRTLRLPAEIFNKHDKTMRISVGPIISVEEQKQHQGSNEEFAAWLKAKTYALRNNKK